MSEYIVSHFKLLLLVYLADGFLALLGVEKLSVRTIVVEGSPSLMTDLHLSKEDIMNTRISRRSLIGGSLALSAMRFVSPLGAWAQGSGYGPCQPATADQEWVTTFVTDYFNLFNEGSPALLEITDSQLWGSLFGSSDYNVALSNIQGVEEDVKTLAVTDVCYHETGFYSIQVAYTRFDATSQVYTQRWFIQLLDGVHPFLAGTEWVQPPFVPDDKTTTLLEVQLDTGNVQLSAQEIPAGEFLVYNVNNVNERTVLSTGLYVLSEGVTAEEAAAEIDSGNYEFLEYVGATPAWPGYAWTHTFLVEPGATYFVYLFQLDENGLNPQPLKVYTTFTVEETVATPSATP